MTRTFCVVLFCCVGVLGCGGGDSTAPACSAKANTSSPTCNRCLEKNCCAELTACVPGTECNMCARDNAVGCSSTATRTVEDLGLCTLADCRDECEAVTSGGAAGTGGSGGSSGTGGTGGTAATACTPGEQVACACGGGVEGFQSCLKNGSGYDECFCPTSTCASANDGTCDEPTLCDVGTDGTDCCVFANDGICDGPPLCDAGTEGADCCASANDGTCDEPTLCAVGTDGADCMTSMTCDDTCTFAKDGTCDEGVGVCDRGTDTTDCFASCDDSCGMIDDVCDETGDTPLCSLGTDCTDCMGDSCTAAKDGECDEMLCDTGTDCTDCGG